LANWSAAIPRSREIFTDVCSAEGPFRALLPFRSGSEEKFPAASGENAYPAPDESSKITGENLF
jgi:hypothetical protein